MCFVLCWAVQLLWVLNLGRGKGEMTFRGPYWALPGMDRGKELPKYRCVVFRSLSYFQNPNMYVWADAHTHTHTHRQTPFATLHPVPDFFPVEFWPWLCAANSQHMEGVFFKKGESFLALSHNIHTCTHSLKQTMKLSLYYTYTHINSLPATTPV